MHAFRIVNVFTVDGDRFSGNPLCVFEDARGLTDAQMQALARQMNLSETTFVLPSERADAHVRIFTPGFEMPFAGHPTLGTASVVARGRDRVTLEMKAGLVRSRATATRGRCARRSPPTTRPVDATARRARAHARPARRRGPRRAAVGRHRRRAARDPDRDGASSCAPRGRCRRCSSAGGSPRCARRSDGVPVGARTADEWTVRFFFTSNGAVTRGSGDRLGVREPRRLVARDRRRAAAHAPRCARATRSAGRRGSGCASTPSGGIYVTGAVIELGRGTVDV